MIFLNWLMRLLLSTCILSVLIICFLLNCLEKSKMQDSLECLICKKENLKALPISGKGPNFLSSI